LAIITNFQEKKNGKLGGKAMELGAWTVKPNHKVVKEVDSKENVKEEANSKNLLEKKSMSLMP
jgi:hypothetical protein